MPKFYKYLTLLWLCIYFTGVAASVSQGFKPEDPSLKIHRSIYPVAAEGRFHTSIESVPLPMAEVYAIESPRLKSMSASVPPAVYYVADTLCEGDRNVQYEPFYVSSSNDYDYDWGFTGAVGGPIQLLSNNNRKVKIDWINGPGDYRLVSEEYYRGVSTGNITYYNVHVIAKADVSVAQADTVCEGESASVELTFSGSGPWSLTYKINGTANQTLNTSTNPHTMVLPANATTLDLRTVVDNGPCSTTKSGLSFLNITYYPDPTTGPIYH